MKKRAPGIRARIPVLLAVALLCTAIAGMQSASAQGAQYTSDQLVNMVAPVALYPDDLLTNVLTASTVPDQVTQASQYVSSMGGKVSSMPDNDWDPSVKALLYFPDVLSKMTGDMNWTQNLGNAVINQMSDVLSAVQTFRSRAYDAGNLQSNTQQKVVVEQPNIVIEPSNPDLIYVPSYDPVQVVNTGHPVAAFATGVAVANWWHYNNVNWYNRNIVVNPPYISHYNYRPGGYYYNNLVTRPGYVAPTVWNPATRAGYGNVNRVGAADVNRVGGGNVRTGNTVRAGNTVNINTGGNTANRVNAADVNRNAAAVNRVSTSDINSRLQQGLKTTGGVNRPNAGTVNMPNAGAVNRPNAGAVNRPDAGAVNRAGSGGAFGGMNSGAGARAESQRGSVSRSSSSANIQRSSGSFDRGGGGGNRGGGGGRRR